MIKAHQKKMNTTGAWPSPITAQFLGERVKLGEAQWDVDGGGILWVENVSGRGHLRHLRFGKKAVDVSADVNVGGRVGYGGGELAISRDFILFAGKDGCLYRRDFTDGKIKAITPQWGAAASPVISPNENWVMYVYSDGETDLLAVVNSQGHGWPSQLVRGADFYTQPTWHPGGEMIAWMEWDHPFMPWQAGRIKLGEVGGMQVKLFSEDWVAGSQQEPASQPRFSPDGKWLSFVKVNGDWDELILLNLKRKTRRILLSRAGLSFGLPGWLQGERNYGWSADSQRIIFRHVEGGRASLWEVQVKTGHSRQIPTEPFTWISQPCISPHEGEVLVHASSPCHPQQLVCCRNGGLESVVKPFAIDFSKDLLPEARPVEWHARDGTLIHGFYFAPSNPGYEWEGKPPLIVEMHGGPTLHNQQVFNPEHAFFTSRGFAILAVDYRGSSGYGRTYQDLLRGQWGVVDVEDAVSGAQAMIRQGLAEGERLVIMGRSAGGFSVLNALIQYPGLFRAGICAYPVCDLLADGQQTHKLERYYNEYLVGDIKKDIKRYKERSPVLHADKIRDPIAIFHGENDPVVPVEQSQQIVQILQHNKIPHLFKIYEDEGHGFKKTETLVDYYQQILVFLDQHLFK